MRFGMCLGSSSPIDRNLLNHFDALASKESILKLTLNDAMNSCLGIWRIEIQSACWFFKCLDRSEWYSVRIDAAHLMYNTMETNCIQ